MFQRKTKSNVLYLLTEQKSTQSRQIHRLTVQTKIKAHHLELHCRGGAVVGCQTRHRKVTSSTPGRGAIKSTRSTQPSIHLG